MNQKIVDMTCLDQHSIFNISETSLQIYMNVGSQILNARLVKLLEINMAPAVTHQWLVVAKPVEKEETREKLLHESRTVTQMKNRITVVTRKPGPMKMG